MNSLKLKFNIFEKIFLGSMITSSVVFMGYLMFKKESATEKANVFKVRQQLLRTPNIKMLFSTMSFFYLMGFKSQHIPDFITLLKVIDSENPKLVAVPVSKEDYQHKFTKILSHPRFKKSMEKFIFDLSNQNFDQVLHSKDFNLKNMEMIMLVNHCQRIKNCKVVYCKKPKKYYQAINEADLKNPHKNENRITSHKAQVEDYVEILIQQLKPKMKITFPIESPFKEIIGLVEPELLDDVAERWKLKFKQTYSHIVRQDEDLMEEKRARQKQNGQK